jgi:general secretion pathway protein J
MSRRNRSTGVTLMELLIAVTLVSLLSVGILFAMRVGLDAMERTNRKINWKRRVAGADRVLHAQLGGLMPAKIRCAPSPDVPPAEVWLFQGESQTLRFVSTYSLNAAWRGRPQILEYQVIPADNGQGLRLIVNEIPYYGVTSSALPCAGVVADPLTGGPLLQLPPVAVSTRSFVLADRLASCQFSYLDPRAVAPAPRWVDRWRRIDHPAAIRISFAHLEPDPSRLQTVSVTVPIRIERHWDRGYADVPDEPKRP